MKAMGELAALVVTCCYVFYCNGRFQTKKATYKLPTARLLLVLFCFWILLIVAYYFNLPHLLAPTHPEVHFFLSFFCYFLIFFPLISSPTFPPLLLVSFFFLSFLKVIVAKHEAREKCKKLIGKFDFAAAIVLRENEAGKKLALEQLSKAAPTIGRFLATHLSSILFSVGVMYSIGPFLFLLCLRVANVQSLGDNVWAVVLPIINVVSLFAFCVWLSFYFVIDGYSVSTCLGMSGSFSFFFSLFFEEKSRSDQEHRAIQSQDFFKQGIGLCI